jgi:hypothetical protein
MELALQALGLSFVFSSDKPTDHNADDSFLDEAPNAEINRRQ